MRIVSWNMGCGPRSRYRRTHAEAWRHLLCDLTPDIAFVQEALLDAPLGAAPYRLHWSEQHGGDSGTAIAVRSGIDAIRVPIYSEGSYVAGAEVRLFDAPTLFVSLHVGGDDYRQHLQILRETLSGATAGRPFVIGGDFNAARHLDDVQGGRWFTNYFNGLAESGFRDCHWTQHGCEVQTFWGHQAKEPYQDDHFFVDATTLLHVSDCNVIDNPIVRELSDHGPLALTVA